MQDQVKCSIDGVYYGALSLVRHDVFPQNVDHISILPPYSDASNLQVVYICLVSFLECRYHCEKWTVTNKKLCMREIVPRNVVHIFRSLLREYKRLSVG